MIQFGSYVHSLINKKGGFLSNNLLATIKECEMSLITSIQFTKPMKNELSQLIQVMFRVKVQSNALEKVQSSQSLNCLKSQIMLEDHPNNL